MKIVLTERVHKLGDIGQVVNVANGYARNFLIPQGKAQLATPEIIQNLDKKLAQLKKDYEARRAQTKETADLLSAKMISVESRAKPDGTLYGSISVGNVFAKINELLRSAQRPPIQKGQVRLAEKRLRAIGKHTVTVDLDSEISADIVLDITAKPETS